MPTFELRKRCKCISSWLLLTILSMASLGIFVLAFVFRQSSSVRTIRRHGLAVVERNLQQQLQVRRQSSGICLRLSPAEKASIPRQGKVREFIPTTRTHLNRDSDVQCIVEICDLEGTAEQAGKI